MNRSAPSRITASTGAAIVALVSIAVFFSSSASATWITGSWSNRIELTVPSGTVGENLTDFPVYVDLSDLGSGFFSAVKSDGSDIRVTASDGETEVPYELVSIDTGTESGELYFKGTLASGSDTSFYIYYGNASASAYAATDTYGRDNVWNSGFAGVYHLEEDPGGSAPQFADSTGNGHDASSNGLSSGSSTAGKIGNAVTISDNQSIQFGDLGLTDSVSITAFIDGSAAETFTEFFYWNSSNHFQVKTFVNLFFGGSGTGNDTSTGGTGKYLGQYAVTADSSGSVNRYKDGALLSIYPVTLAAPTLTGQSLQAPLPSTTTINGYIDEVRLSSAIRSGGWVAAEYLNINAPNSFYTVGSEEDQPEESSAPTLTTESVSDIGTTTATGNGTVASDGGETITERGIVWSTSSSPTTSDSKATSAGTTGSFTASLTGLSPGTLYYVRAYAVNSVGTAYGDEETFTTSVAAPTVTTQAVSGIGETSATGNGTVSSDGGGTVTERGIVWSTSSSPTTSDSKATSAGTTGSFTASLTSLVSDTLYYVRAYATNSAGTSYGDEVTFTTDGSSAPVQLRGIIRFRGGVGLQSPG